MDQPMKMTVDAHELGENDAVTRAIGILIWHAMKGGVTEAGETCTLMVPDILIGPSREQAIPTGEWEIVMKKVGD